MSLRARLLAVVLALVALALVAAGWATHAALRAFLVDRVDTELQEARGPALASLVDIPGRPGDALRRRFAPGVPPDAVVEVRDASGETVDGFSNRQDGGPAPALPDDPPPGASTVDVGGGEYRLLVLTGDGAGAPEGRVSLVEGASLLIAVPLDDVEATLTRLVWIEVAVGAVTLTGLALLALWLVRLGLRPLERIGQTADAIAAGDLSQRVADDDPRTEVGRLGRTLNDMLGRIERSFAERRAGEERLRRFVADASHELQTPLTSVRGYAELFRRGAAADPDDLATAMRRIEAEAARMGVLVDDLLLLARLDQGRPLDRRPVDLAAIAREMAADARVVEPDRPITVAGDAPVVVEGDDARLRQVVANLLSNARAHTPAGTPVTLTTAVRDGEAVLEVTDRGPGLVPEHARRVFERFFRADPSRARASGGSGLGLSIVEAIAGAHGGRAELDSEPGRGATFRLVLPLAGPGGGEGRPEGPRGGPIGQTAYSSRPSDIPGGPDGTR